MPAPLLPPRFAIDRDQVRSALAVAQRIIDNIPAEVTVEERATVQKLRDEFRRAEQVNQAFILAMIADEFAPARLFTSWASVRKIRDWRDEGKVEAIVRNGRVCCKPSSFFAHWRSMPDERKRRAGGR